MTVKEMIDQRLRIAGKDGLYNDMISCACLLDDLMPCNNDCIAECEAGYKVPCPRISNPDDPDIECDCDPKDPNAWHIQEGKER